MLKIYFGGQLTFLLQRTNIFLSRTSTCVNPTVYIIPQNISEVIVTYHNGCMVNYVFTDVVFMFIKYNNFIANLWDRLWNKKLTWNCIDFLIYLYNTSLFNGREFVACILHHIFYIYTIDLKAGGRRTICNI